MRLGGCDDNVGDTGDKNIGIGARKIKIRRIKKRKNRTVREFLFKGITKHRKWFDFHCQPPSSLHL